MYETIKVDDRCLTGKRVIRKNDVINLLPEEMRENVEAAYVYVDIGQPRWVLFLSDDTGGYQYHPFSHEMEYDPYAKRKDFGKIYLWRKARYLRDKYLNKGTEKEVYTVYICRPTRMYFLKEVKVYHLEDENGPGYATKSKWFRAFP